MSPSSAASRPSSGSSDDAPAGIIARFERAAAPLAHRISESPAVRALQASLPIAFAVALAALAGRLATALAARPFAGWGPSLKALVAFLPSAFALASLAMVVVLSLRLARELRFPALPLAAASCAAFALALPRAAFASPAAFARTLGVSGVFTAIVVVLAAAGVTSLARRRLGAHAGTFAGAIAIVALCGALFALRVSPAGALAAALEPLATLGDSFVALATITAIESLLWLVGIHGPALLAAIVFPVYLSLQMQNSAAFGRHDAIPHIVVVSTFLFVFPGGAGATFPLVVLLLRSRVRRLRTTAYAALVPTLFNLNEPVIFGLPVAYNPVLAVPFVLAPLVLAATTYAAIASGLVGRPLFYSPTTIPSIVNAFLTTLDWRACVLLLVNLAVAAAIWFPFVRVYERTEAAREARAASAGGEARAATA
jgi:PTS system cellobiose-specific IIC component